MSILFGELARLEQTDLAGHPAKKDLLAQASILLAIDDFFKASYGHIKDKQLTAILNTYRTAYEQFIINNLTPGYYYYQPGLYVGVLAGLEGTEVYVHHFNMSKAGLE